MLELARIAEYENALPGMMRELLQRLGANLIEQEVSLAMQRGTELELTTRVAHEHRYGHVIQPLVVVEGEYSVSLDGMTHGGDRLLEVNVRLRERSRRYGRRSKRVDCLSTTSGRCSTS